MTVGPFGRASWYRIRTRIRDGGSGVADLSGQILQRGTNGFKDQGVFVRASQQAAKFGAFGSVCQRGLATRGTCQGKLLERNLFGFDGFGEVP